MRWILLLALLIAMLPQSGPATTAAQEAKRTFPETGKTVQDRFLDYWSANGGLTQQGFPITDEVQQRSNTDGKEYTVQFFERAVFERHPENAKPYDVLLSLLGNYLYKEKYPSGAPGQKPNTAAGSVLFPETGKRLGGAFLDYWNKNGGLAQQGFPISDEFQEKSDLDGKTYTVQYFERAVLEQHPENKAPYNVLLSQLGKYRYDRLARQNAPYVDTLDRVWTLVRDNYVYTDFRGQNWPAVREQYEARVAVSDGEEDAYRLIFEMIENLGDKHSSFLDPERRQEDDALQRGELQLVGIGVTVQEVDGGLRISSVIPGGPAERAGLRVFDLIRAVDGTPVTGDPDASRRVRGQEGTPVTLTVESQGQSPRDVTIVRERVKFTYHATARRLPGTNIAYLNLPTFYMEGIAAEVEEELEKLAIEGPLDGLVIDVRQNSGGFIDELVDTEKLFIDGGVPGYQLAREGRTPSTIPSGQTLPVLRGKPIVVLVSGLCESACERLAVAMNDLKRGTVLGTNTAGNTETVYTHDLPDGSRLMLAQATFVRADGSSIEDKGLAPGVVMDVPWYRYSLEDDPQVDEAVRLVGSGQ